MASSPPDLASEKSGLAILSLGQELDLDQWFLGHPDAKGVWIRFTKKGARVCVFQPSVTIEGYRLTPVIPIQC